MKSFSCIIIGIFILSVNYAQSPSFTNYTIEDGLPSNTIYHISEDKLGYIWLASDSGIARYDGLQFQQFNKDDGLPDNEIFDFFIDSQDRIWLHTFNGELCYIKDAKVFNGENTPFLQRLKGNNSIVRVREDKLGWLYFLDASGHLKIVNSDLIIQEYSFRKNYYELVRTKNNEVVIVTQINGLYSQIDLETKEYSILDLEIISEEEYSLLANLCRQNTKPINEKFHSSSYFKLPEHLIISHLNQYWHYGTNLPLKFSKTNQANDLNTLEIYANSAFIDSENNLWFSTLTNGIYKYNPQIISSFDIVNDFDESLLSSMYKDENDLLVGDNNGNLFSYENTYFKKIEYQKGQSSKTKLRSYKIRSIIKDKFNNYYIGTDDSLIFLDSTFRQKCPTYYNPFKDLIIREDEILISSSIRIYSHDFKCELNKVIFNDRTTSLMEDTYNTVWAGSNRGIYYKKVEAEEFVKFSIEETLNYTITDIQQLENKIIFATNGNGVFIHNLNQESKVINYTIGKNEGLPSNNIKHLYKADDTTLWASSSEGLSKIKFEGESILSVQNLNSNDGLHSNQVLQSTVQGDSLFVLSPRGISVLSLHQIKNSATRNPLIQIDKIMINDSLISKDQLDGLNHDENKITIQLSSPVINHAENLSFRYRLVGNSLKWTQTKDRIISYQGLAPGTYQFETYPVISSKDDVLYESNMVTIDLKIKPIWYNNNYVRFIGFCFVSMFLFWFARRKIRNENEKNKLELKMTSLKQKALVTQMNPHFINNCLSSIQNFILTGNKRSASNYLSKFATLIRMILKNSEDEIITLESELEHLKLYIELEQLRFSNKFSYTFEYPQHDLFLMQRIPTMLIQPLIENSILHGFDFSTKDKHMIRIDLSKAGKYIICEVYDNGKGLSHISEQGQISSLGIATKNIRERISHLKRMYPKSDFSLVDNSQANYETKGTIAKLVLPILDV